MLVCVCVCACVCLCVDRRTPKCCRCGREPPTSCVVRGIEVIRVRIRIMVRVRVRVWGMESLGSE